MLGRCATSDGRFRTSEEGTLREAGSQGLLPGGWEASEDWSAGVVTEEVASGAEGSRGAYLESCAQVSLPGWGLVGSALSVHSSVRCLCWGLELAAAVWQRQSNAGWVLSARPSLAGALSTGTLMARSRPEKSSAHPCRPERGAAG